MSLGSGGDIKLCIHGHNETSGDGNQDMKNQTLFMSQLLNILILFKLLQRETWHKDKAMCLYHSAGSPTSVRHCLS